MSLVSLSLPLRHSGRGPVRLWALALAIACALSACATPLKDADALAQRGQNEQAVSLLSAELQKTPNDPELRAAWLRQRELAIQRLATEVDAERTAGRLDNARAALQRLEALDARHPRVQATKDELQRAQRHGQWVAQIQADILRGRHAEAQSTLNKLLAEAPGHPAARAVALKLREKQAPSQAVAAIGKLGTAFDKPISVEYREAPLRQVLEGLGRSHGLNFVFDKDVRGDAKVSIMLKDVTVDDALRVIFTTQQLERKVLNDSTILVYPNSLAKQREHQDLITRSFYLVNADVKQAQAMVRTLAKTRDMHVDERLNLLVIRDTPEVVSLVERLLTGIDLPDPEVVLDVEVLEVSLSKLDELGIQWPEQVFYGLPSISPEITHPDRSNLRASIINPALVATLRGTNSNGNVLANPRLRARNREKAKILIGERLPVFASTAATANVAGTTTVSYLDVGLKLDVEPTVQLDNDVVMKVNLEVSTLIGRVSGPAGSIGYQVGTRQASTSLRLRDGETQVLAGLIRDEDTKGINGVPGLAELPVVGRLFGLHRDQRTKTEVVLLITPRVVRNIGLPDADVLSLPAGVDASPGAAPLRLSAKARVSVPMAGSGAGGTAGPATGQGDAPAAAPPPGPQSLLLLSTSGQVDVGGMAAVTLQNRSAAVLSGEVEFDPQLFQSAQGGGDRNVGRLPFTLQPGGEQVLMLRVLAAAAGHSTEVSVVGLQATRPDGGAVSVQVQGDGTLMVAAQ